MTQQIFLSISGCVTIPFMQLAEKLLKLVLFKLAILYIITVVINV